MKKKLLTLVPIGGLANRFNAMSAAIALCRDYNIKLRVVWFKDWGMGADFHSLFELSENVDKENVEVIDAKWYHYIYDRPRKRNLWLPYIPQMFMFGKKVYEKEMYSLKGFEEILDMQTRYGSVYLVHCGRFYEPNYNDIVIKKDIEKRVDEIIPLSGGAKKRMIGIHIRRTDNVSSIQNSPLELFMEEMDKELAADKDVLFYVASDSLEEKRKLVDRYKEHIVTSFEQPQRDTRKGIVDAVVDLYALSRTEKIYGSSHSTFSELSAHLTGVELKVLSLAEEEIPNAVTLAAMKEAESGKDAGTLDLKDFEKTSGVGGGSCD